VRTVHPIEAQSYRLLRRAVDTAHLPPRTRDVVERIVHTTADPTWLPDLVADEAALAAGAAALAAGAPLIVDAAMVAAGVTTYPSTCLVATPEAALLAAERGLTRSAAAIRLVATGAAAGGPTGAAAGGPTGAAAGGPTGAAGGGATGGGGPTGGVDGWAAGGGGPTGGVDGGAAGGGMNRAVDGAVWVVGNAPTALAELLHLAEAGVVRPALVIGVPVGYVGAAEAKAALRATGLPSLTNRSARGGSAIAAAAVNALLYGDPLP
jgi:precorrin-8X/cobalt-precorrin-8 methylmutase